MWEVRLWCALWAACCLLAQAPPPDGSKAYEDQPGDQDQPTVLAREKGRPGERSGKLLDVRFYADIAGVYDTGLIAPSVNGAGVTTAATFGIETGYGIIGTRRWKHGQLSVDYRGTDRHYSTRQLIQGLDQFLDLSYSHQFEHHLEADLKETAGDVSLANGIYSYLPLTSTDWFAIPYNELFDIRTRFAQSRIDLTWQKTARLSFGIGGDGYLVRRSSMLLAGLDGYSVRASAAYRLSRGQTVSVDYNQSRFDFQNTFGNARLQSAAAGYAVELSPRWQFAVRGGAILVDSLNIAQVAVDPAIAAIIGRSFANVTRFQSVYAPLAEVMLERRFERSVFTLQGSKGVSPGNGVYLTSRQTAAGLSYSYAGYGRWTLGVNAGYDELATIGQTLGKYTNLQGGAGVTYRMGPETHLELRYDYRHYTTQNALYQKDSSRLSLGLAFSAGATPLAIW